LTLQHTQQQAHALGTHYVCFIYIDFPRSFYFTEHEILTAVCQVSDSSTKLQESPFWDQGQRDTKDVIGRFNSATLEIATENAGFLHGARSNFPA
jgi:hypothetical protein